MVERGRFDRADSHVLQITNHGIHEWSVVPGMPDTGGQNVYVNQFTEALIDQGYRVTIVNRGGYPHPVTGVPRVGTSLHPSGRARIVYLDDGLNEFVRKEDMGERIPMLSADLERRLLEEEESVDLIISHYWDGGVLGAEFTKRVNHMAPHIWVPHSLGALKRRNMEPATWDSLRIDERMARERELLNQIDGAVSTSSAIGTTLTDDYGFPAKYFLPPCIDVDRYHPRHLDECSDVWEALTTNSPMGPDELRNRLRITEISRTDRTKRKDVLIKAFARVRERIPGVALIIALDPHGGEVYAESIELIDDMGLSDDVVVVGSVWDLLPCLYAITDVYCTPSVMEGFGMSAQEAAATSKPVVASDLVPYVAEYLLGDEPKEVAVTGGDAIFHVGQGAIVAPADRVDAFAEALVLVLENEDLRSAMGSRAFDITIPYFTWKARTKDMLNDLGLSPGERPS